MQSPADNRVVYSHRLLGAFIDQNYRLLASQIDYSDLTSFFWIQNLPPLLSLGEPALCSSIVALAAAGLGQANGDRHLINSAGTAYGRGVASLSNICLLADDHAFATCFVLVMYQYFAENPDRQQLYLHIRGLAAILQTRGPQGFRKGLSHDLFSSSRSVLISSSLHARKASFVAEEEWRTIPWQIMPKSSYEQMLDCLSMIPQIAQDFHAARQGDARDGGHLRNLTVIADLWNMISALHKWFLTVADTARPISLVYTHLPCLLDPAPRHLTFPKSHQYRSLAQSNMCRLFWTALTDLYNMLALTYEALAEQGIHAISIDPARQRCQHCAESNQDGGTSRATHDSHYFCTGGAVTLDLPQLVPLFAGTCNPVMLAFACRVFAKMTAEQVCMSLQYCILPQHGTVGKYLCIIPIKFVVWCFTINLPSTSRHLEWAYRVVGSLAECGVPFTTKLFEDRPYMQSSDG